MSVILLTCLVQAHVNELGTNQRANARGFTESAIHKIHTNELIASRSAGAPLVTAKLVDKLVDKLFDGVVNLARQMFSSFSTPSRVRIARSGSPHSDEDEEQQDEEDEQDQEEQDERREEGGKEGKEHEQSVIKVSKNLASAPRIWNLGSSARSRRLASSSRARSVSSSPRSRSASRSPRSPRSRALADALKPDKCPVCLDELETDKDKALPCKHRLCCDCYDGVAASDFPICPLCRGPFWEKGKGKKKKKAKSKVRPRASLRRQTQDLRHSMQQQAFVRRHFGAQIPRQTQRRTPSFLRVHPQEQRRQLEFLEELEELDNLLEMQVQVQSRDTRSKGRGKGKTKTKTKTKGKGKSKVFFSGRQLALLDTLQEMGFADHLVSDAAVQFSSIETAVDWITEQPEMRTEMRRRR